MPLNIPYKWYKESTEKYNNVINSTFISSNIDQVMNKKYEFNDEGSEKIR